MIVAACILGQDKDAEKRAFGVIFFCSWFFVCCLYGDDRASKFRPCKLYRLLQEFKKPVAGSRHILNCWVLLLDAYQKLVGSRKLSVPDSVQ
jgi:hypothetical protein